MSSLSKQWNHRAKLLGDSFSSVMEQSFPEVVNSAIHAIHVQEVIAVPQAKRCLEVGCGWGRIAYELISRRQVIVDGIDISAHFVNLFNERMKGKGHAVAGDMRRLPFADNAFDFVYCIVSLMYLSTLSDQKKGISEMLRVIKPGGRLLFIEPNFWGVQIVKLGGLITFVYRSIMGRPKVETGGIAFRIGLLRRIIEKSGGRIIRIKGYPFLTLVLLPAVAIGKISPSTARIILECASFFDRRFPMAFLSYFVTWEIIKK